MAIKYTVKDIEACLDDDRHLGWGLAIAYDALSQGARKKLFADVARRATALGLDREDLFHWTNSKPARWLVDSWWTDARSATLVETYLNAGTVEKVRP